MLGSYYLLELWFPPDICPGVELLGHMDDQFISKTPFKNYKAATQCCFCLSHRISSQPFTMYQVTFQTQYFIYKNINNYLIPKAIEWGRYYNSLMAMRILSNLCYWLTAQPWALKSIIAFVLGPHECWWDTRIGLILGDQELLWPASLTWGLFKSLGEWLLQMLRSAQTSLFLPFLLH